MANEIILPKMGMAMEEGSLARWLVEEGQRIEVGEPVCEITTDKVDTEIESEHSGYIARLLVQQGETVEIGTAIALVVDTKGELDSLPDVAPAPSREQGGTDASHREHRDEVRPAEQADPSPDPSRPDQVEPAVRMTPAARRRASELGVDLSVLSAPEGTTMMTVEHVEALGADIEDSSRDRVNEIVAKKMTQSFSAPHFYLSAEIDATNLLDAVESSRVEDGSPTVTDLLICLTSRVLREHPEMNACWNQGRPARNSQVNAGFAVDTEAGLIVPVIKDASSLNVSELTVRRKELTASARSRSLTAADVEEGTWTLSNLGMYQVDSFQAILNPPQAMILAAGRIKERPWVDEGEIVARKSLMINLSVDHRMADGATAARFLDALTSAVQRCEL